MSGKRWQVLHNNRRKRWIMGNTLRQMHHKIAGAEQLESVVRTMKAQAAANIAQYETAVLALADYCRST
jgi:F-type H+-transporting ATPase subunit gamma